MPRPACKITCITALTGLLLAGCGTPPAGEQAARIPQAPPAQKMGAGYTARKTLAPETDRWSAPPPAPPARPPAALEATLARNPGAPGADAALFDLAMHDMRRGNLTAAARNLERLRSRFPLSPLYPESAFHLGLALQAAGRHEEAWIFLRSSLSRETRPARRALLEAALGDVYESRGQSHSALLSYARALASDPRIHRGKALTTRIETLAGEVALHRLRAALERFADSPAAPHLRAPLARREAKAARESAPETPPAEQPPQEQPPQDQPPQEQPREAVRAQVGIMLPLSGPAASAGERVYQGIRLALRHSLAQYPHLHIQLAVRDTKSTAGSPGAAAEVAAELIGEKESLALIGPLLTDAAQAAAGVANRLGAPMLTPFAVRMRMRAGGWAFRNSLTNRQQAQAAAVYAYRRLGYRRFAVLHPANEEGSELARAFTQAVETLGGKIVKAASFPGDATDFGTQMRALGGLDDRRLARRKIALGLRKNDPFDLPLAFEALFAPVFHDKAVLIAPQLLFYNMGRVLLLGGNGWNHPRLIEHGEDYVEGAVFVAGFFAESTDPKVMRFAREFRSRFGRAPDLFSALGYDAASIVFSALAEGARTREEMRASLARLRGFAGVMGRTDMGVDNDAQREMFVLTVAQKKIRYVEMVAPHTALEEAAESAGVLPPAQTPATQ